MRYVGHLDLMRFFQKALNRAGVPLSYSKGFHPHPLISFAAPLSVGVTSCGEYMDIVTEVPLDISATQNALNEQMVTGMQIISVTGLPEKAKNAMAAVEAAAYYVYFKSFAGFKDEHPDHMLSTFTEAIHTFYTDAAAITVIKQTKKSEREIDLKPLIYDFRAMTVCDVASDTTEAKLSRNLGQPMAASTHLNRDHTTDILPVSLDDKQQFCLSDDDIVFYMELSCGSTDNIKPELLMEHFLSSMHISPDTYRIGIHRIDMFQKDSGGNFVSLGATVEES